MKKELRDYQRKAFELYKDSPYFGLLLPCGSGKAQPVTSLVFTETGYVPMGEITEGQRIYDGNGNITTVEKVFDLGMQQCFRYFLNDNTVFEVAGEHLNVIDMTHKQTKRVIKEVLTTNAVRSLFDLRSNTHYFVIPHGIPTGIKKDGNYFLQGFSLSFNERFSGVYTFAPATKDAENIFLNLVKDNKIPYKKEGHYYLINDTSSLLYVLIQSALQNDVLTSTKEDRILFVKGVVASLGKASVKGKNERTFYSIQHKDEAYIDCIANAMRSIGSFVTKKDVSKEYEYKKISFRLPKEALQTKEGIITSTNFRRHIDVIQPIGKKHCKCIKVASSAQTYITDNFCVTHNTTVATRIAQHKDKPTIIIAPDALCNQWKNALIEEGESEGDIFVITSKEKNKKDFKKKYDEFLER